MHANMTDEHRTVFRKLMKLNPTNIHLISNVTYGARLDFESLWSKHGPTAARFYLFPQAWNGTLKVKGDEEG